MPHSPSDTAHRPDADASTTVRPWRRALRAWGAAALVIAALGAIAGLLGLPVVPA